MKSFKILIAAVALAAVAAPSAIAQQKGKQSPEQQVQRIEEAVGSLTADQKKKITAVITKASEATSGMSKEEKKEKSGSINKKRNEDIMGVLTPDQKKKYQDYLASMKKK